jgi:hypothetical protein
VRSLRSCWLPFLLILIPVVAVTSDTGFLNGIIGQICEARGGILHCRYYTASFNGYVQFETSGIFNRVKTDSEIVFTLHIDNGTLYRLIFYCKDGMLVTTRDIGNGTFGGYEFCESVPFKQGVRIVVDGTLIVPSNWNPELSTPRLTFAGDLYVFELQLPHP